MNAKFTWILFFSVLTLAIHAQQSAPDNGESAETVVNKQLDAYNSRDIEAFLATFSPDIKIYNFDGRVTMEGHDGLRRVYAKMFDNTPNLHCTIKNRIVINNKVIDEESVTFNDRTVHGVAIYEVNGGLITKVVFVN